MGTISYQASYGSWSGTVNLNYSAAYDRKKNQTTVTFQDCTAVYSSAIGYESKTTTTVTVKDEAGNEKTVTLSTTLSSSDAGGGTKTFTATPNPASVALDHSAGAGEKTVEISAHTEFSLVPSSGQSRVNVGCDSGSVKLSSATVYTFRKNVSAGVTVDVRNVTNGNTALADGDLILSGDILKLWRTANTGYTITAAHFGGGGILDTGAAHTVTGNTTATVTAVLKSYELTVVTDGKALAAVKRGAETLKSGDTVSHFDVLSVTVSAKNGYKVSAADVNGTAISPDTAVSHTVSGPVTVTAAAKPLSNLFVDEGGARRRVLLYIDDNGTRALYRAVFK